MIWPAFGETVRYTTFPAHQTGVDHSRRKFQVVEDTSGDRSRRETSWATISPLSLFRSVLCEGVQDQVDGMKVYPTLDVLEARSGNRHLFLIVVAQGPCHR